jgi:hypothetical protein
MVGGQQAKPAASMVTTAASVFCAPVPPEKAKDKKAQAEAAACRQVFERAAERCKAVIEGQGSEAGVDGIKTCINRYRKGEYSRTHPLITGTGKAAITKKQFEMMKAAEDRTPPPPPPPKPAPPKLEAPPKPKAKPFNPAASCPQNSECAKAFKKVRLAIYSAYPDDADERAAATKKYITFPNDFDSSDEVYQKAGIGESTHAAMEEAKTKGTWKGRSLGAAPAADDSEREERPAAPKPAKKSKKAVRQEDVAEEREAEKPKRREAPDAPSKRDDECGPTPRQRKMFDKLAAQWKENLHPNDAFFLSLLVMKYSLPESWPASIREEVESLSCEAVQRLLGRVMTKVGALAQEFQELKGDRKAAEALHKRLSKISIKGVRKGKEYDLEFRY